MTSDLCVDDHFSVCGESGPPTVTDSMAADGLQKLVVDLLLKNQVLREAVNVRTETLMQITRIVAPRSARDCNCHAERQVTQIGRLLQFDT